MRRLSSTAVSREGARATTFRVSDLQAAKTAAASQPELSFGLTVLLALCLTRLILICQIHSTLVVGHQHVFITE